MLRAYGPNCDGGIIDAGKGQRIPDDATWIDLEEPTRDEDKLVEECVRVQIPTREDMSEIEPSSRLYEQNGALYMTLSTIYGVEEGHPKSDPVSFVLTDNRLVTVRYVTPKPVRAFQQHAHKDHLLVKDSLTAAYNLLDVIIDRLADELEEVGREIDKISAHIFAKSTNARRIPADRLTSLLSRIGRAQSLLVQIRISAVSTARMLSFFLASDRLRSPKAAGLRDHIQALLGDTKSLTDHSAFLGDNLTFLLDASLGLISIEQNAAMKLFSWAALVFLPPTLIAGIYGMNFDHMPELRWLFGYPMALTLMLASAVLPLWFLKRRGWI
ncbi:magnesium transporter CorA family protein [Sphingomonas daechungensis]|uniref:Magnesium transporter CorA family protein n=1 Tax=Sphingomonas daechungensis TaxID=1176646 RepID=A0ABX6T2P3_9SPHN|nr:magnesium transporter CorA family protein [Sphingomonas daechungensis]QNP43940.1 magnesium transporter CorA family protein [Sphingomonas daechungensis]